MATPSSETEAQVVPEAARATIVIYSVITLMGVMAAASAKAYVDNSWELAILVLSSALALSLAHAWAGVLAQMLEHGRTLGKALILAELKFSALALGPAILSAICLLIFSLLMDDFEREVTFVLLVQVAVLFWAGESSARRKRLGGWTSFRWGMASAVVGLLIVTLKVVFGG